MISTYPDQKIYKINIDKDNVKLYLIHKFHLLLMILINLLQWKKKKNIKKKMYYYIFLNA